ncbi:TonB-dependent receptor [Komagataeibacter rhaeticus]|nr:TonB-dependent receptor [Komagataeibacter rhaeticus]
MGYRYTSKLVSISADIYRANYYNRMQSITSGTLVDPHSIVTNVGSINLNGADAEVVFTPIRHLAISNSMSYAHSIYGNDLQSGGTLYATKGKHTVAYPSWMCRGGCPIPTAMPKPILTPTTWASGISATRTIHRCRPTG